MEAGGAEEALQGRLPAEVPAPNAGGAAGQRRATVPLWGRAAAFLQELPCGRIQGEADDVTTSHMIALLQGAMLLSCVCLPMSELHQPSS